MSDDSDAGGKFYSFQLIRMIYYDQTIDALSLIQTDPDEIRTVDEESLLTPLHVAIFRENVEVLQVLLAHHLTDLFAQDRFGRSPLDMLQYVSSEAVHQLVMRAIYPDEATRMVDEAYDQGREAGIISPLKPPVPRI